MNPKKENEEIIDRFARHIPTLQKLSIYLNHKWSDSNNDNVRRFLQTGAAETTHVTPIYNTTSSDQSQRGHLYMVQTPFGAIIVRHLWVAWDAGEEMTEGEIRKFMVAGIEDNVMTLMNCHSLVGDSADALCKVIGGNVHVDTTKYPLNPNRLTLNEKDYALSNGMQLSIDSEGKTEVIHCAKDYKVRSNRKVTMRVNKEFKEYLKNASAMAKLIKPTKPDNAPYNWDEQYMTKLYKEHLGLENRIRWGHGLEAHGFINNPQKLFSESHAFHPTTDEEGVISVTNNFSVPKLILEAAKEGNYLPMAVILVDNSEADTNKRLLNAVRTLEGGFRVGES